MNAVLPPAKLQPLPAAADVREQEKSPEERIQYIDSLRGLSALFVAITHLVCVTQPASTPVKDALVHLAAAGVTAFFILSAYSLSRTMPAHQRNSRPLMSFFISRYFRIAPLYYFMLILTVAYHYCAFDKSYSANMVLAASSFTFGLIPCWREGVVQASWTIGVEVLVYLAFPVINRFCSGLLRKTVLLAASYGLFCLGHYCNGAYLQGSFFQGSFFQGSFWQGALWQGFHYNLLELPLQLCKFIVGMWLFDLLQKAQIRWQPRIVSAACLSVSLMFGVAWLFGPSSWPMYDPILLALPVALTFFGCSIHPWNFLVNPVWSYLGRISYSFYLWHCVIILALVPAFKLLAPHQDSPVAMLESLALLMICLVPSAALSYELIEKKGIALGKTILRKSLSTRLLLLGFVGISLGMVPLVMAVYPLTIRCAEDSAVLQKALLPQALAGTENVEFGKFATLKGIDLLPKADGSIEVVSLWQAGKRADRQYSLAVHIMDRDHNIIRGQDHSFAFHKGQCYWIDRFRLEKKALAGAAMIGLAIYNDPQCPLVSTAKNADWENRRLLIPLSSR